LTYTLRDGMILLYICALEVCCDDDDDGHSAQVVVGLLLD